MANRIVARVWEAEGSSELPPDQVAAALARGAVVWVDAAADTGTWQELGEQLAAVLGSHGSLDLRALEPDRAPPKVKILDDGTVIVRSYLLGMDDSLKAAELHAVAGDRYLLTIRYPEDGTATPAAPPEVRIRLDSALRRVIAGGGMHLLYVLLDELVDDELELVERFDERADSVEERVFQPGAAHEGRAAVRARHADVQRDILRLKRELGDFRRRVLPFGEVRELVQEELRRDPDGRPDFREVAEAVLRVVELTDNVRDLLTSSFEAELAQVSNETNDIMKRVTSWAAILLVPTLIAGIYGMNFRHMPELGWGLGYPGALGLMILSAGGLYMLFRNRDWL